MNESTLIRTVNSLLFLASAFLFYGLTYYVTDEHFVRTERTAKGKTETVQVLPTKEQAERRTVLAPEVYELRNKLDRVVITYQVAEYEYIGTFFVTAYCPWECGYNGNNYPKGWTTSSGTICHYSERNSEPTTCAIDRNYFGYNETIAIDFGDEMKLYVTEDTGAFRGKWIDCFVETMDEVRYWETGYYPVYAVTYETRTYSIERTELLYERFRNHLFMRCNGGRFHCGNDCRIDD